MWWFASLKKCVKHDTEYPYWDEVSQLNNTNQSNPKGFVWVNMLILSTPVCGLIEAMENEKFTDKILDMEMKPQTNY